MHSSTVSSLDRQIYSTVEERRKLISILFLQYVQWGVQIRAMQLRTSKIPLLFRPERLERGGPCWLLKLRWMGTQRVQMKGVLPWLVRWACRASTRGFCSTLAAIVGLVQNICFLTVHYFSSFVPIVQQAGQAAVLGFLSLSICVSGCGLLTPFIQDLYLYICGETWRAVNMFYCDQMYEGCEGLYKNILFFLFCSLQNLTEEKRRYSIGNLKYF